MLPIEKRITSKKELREWLQYEKRLYPCNALSYLLGIGESAILRKHQILLRKAEFHKNCKHRVRYAWNLIQLRSIQSKYALHVPLNCCEKGLRIMHLGPVLINGRATVGRDCRIHMNAALVAGGTNDDVPTLGDSVVVGYGAVVLGGARIANYVAIGANAVVNKDCLEENVAIAGVPAKIISRNGSKEWNKKAKQNN